MVDDIWYVAIFINIGLLPNHIYIYNIINNKMESQRDNKYYMVYVYKQNQDGDIE